MTTSQTIIIVIAFISMWQNSVSAGAAPCDSEGRCKYGGVCGSDGLCACAFNCEKELWGSRYYCGGKMKSGVKFYRNICQVLSHACQLQKEIPLIPFHHKREFKQKCKVSQKAEATERFCSNPVNFTSRCGFGSTTLHLGGICMEDMISKQNFCHCPANRIGENCERVISVFNVPPTRGITSDEAKSYQIVKIAILVAIGVIFLICLCIVVLRSIKLVSGSFEEKTRIFCGSKKTYTMPLIETTSENNRESTVVEMTEVGQPHAQVNPMFVM